MNSFATQVWETDQLQALKNIIAADQGGFRLDRLLKVDGRPGKLPLLAWVTPLTNGGGTSSYHVMTIYDPERSSEFSRACLVAAYRFTKAELRLVEQLLQGRMPAEAAEALGVTIHTVRTYLKRLYQKVGVRSQATLVRKLFQVSLSGMPVELAAQAAF